MFEVIFYKDSKGNEPIREYLTSLKTKASTSKQDRVKFYKNHYLHTIVTGIWHKSWQSHR